MHRFGWLAGLLLVSTSALAASEDTDLATEIQLTIEESLLQETLDRYDQERRREERALEQVTSLLSRIEEQLGQEELDLSALEVLEQALARQREASQAAAEEAHDLRRQIYQHHRRLALLEVALAASRVRRASDLITGRWRARVLPAGQEGVFELQLEGTLVSGTFRLDGGYAGSFRGTYVAGTLRLERIDAQHGFDVIYEARLDEGDPGRLDGSWRTTLLNAPGPAGGSWLATRMRETP